MAYGGEGCGRPDKPSSPVVHQPFAHLLLMLPNLNRRRVRRSRLPIPEDEMSRSRSQAWRTTGLGAVAALTFVLAACGGGGGGGASSGGGLTGTLPGAGASSQEKAMNAWLAGFQDTNPDVQVSYDPTGSGTGRQAFLNKSVLFAGSDKAMSPDEVAKAKDRCFGGEALELPVYISPIAVAYNLPGVPEHLNLRPETIAKIFGGEIKTWNDPAIAADNPGAKLPSTGIIPVNRSDNSGTTENFTEYLAEASHGAWPHEPSEAWPISGTQSGAQTSGVVQTLQGTEGTIAYLDASQVPKGMGTVAVGVGDQFVPYSAEAATAVIDASSPAPDATDKRLTLDLARDTTQSGAYPVVLVSYEIACSVYDKKQDADNVKALLTYIASPEGQQRAADPSVAGAAPISDALRQKVDAAINTITTTSSSSS
jgi:phosphate transport system substrate-binding protein